MINFINNIGDYFASNYFDEDFARKVIEKSGFSTDAVKDLTQTVARLKPDYFKLKQRFIENHLRTKDKIGLSNAFHTKVLSALGYDAQHTDYHNLYPIDDKNVLPIRHILYRGDQVHLMVMEMHALIKAKEEDAEPDGLFEQQYEEEGDGKMAGEQKYNRSQWIDIFDVPKDVKISPMIINKAVSNLFLLPIARRPKFILLCAGNEYFLLEAEKWFRGSYLQINIERLFDDAAINRQYYALFYMLLAKDCLCPDADRVLLDQLDEESHKAAYEVTKDLKEGVINAVQQLANEAVKYMIAQGKTYKEIDATKLKDDCLNMVYRLLFLFYAESREELDILPSKDAVYERGYSLEMLRDLEQVPLVTESSMNGFFFHNSIYQLFGLLAHGYQEHEGSNKSFKIRHLDSPMFDDAKLHYLQDVKIRNIVWRDVICELSLSKMQAGKTRGRISYANLGINQLGSVYESLLAFRGFLAEEDYIEVHRKRKANETSEKVVRTDGSFLVPRSRFADFDDSEIYYNELANGDREQKIIDQGTFIYRLSGRDRQKSASYYTPEILTRTTVKYTLKPILQRLETGEIEALDLLKLKILEPAMGAAAFHNEVINQLAEAYLTHRQVELNKKVDPNKYTEELQKIKAYIALNNVYGVDLNPTAIELGKLSLWLNVIHKDMQTPFFGYRLGVGNAVVGSWLKVYKHKDFSFVAKGSKSFEKKEWWNTAPKHLKFGKKGIVRKDDEIYHFLLPDTGMVPSASIKLLKENYSAHAKRVSEWKKKFTEPIGTNEYIKLQKISRAIDILLEQHYEIQNNINLITQQKNDFFGGELQTSFVMPSYDDKDKIAKERLKPNAPYYKLKQIMDYWCSLWFWDVRDAVELPTRDDWYNDILQILNIQIEHTELEVDENTALRDYKKDQKEAQKQLVDIMKQSSTSLFTNERSTLVNKYAEQYRFFHYELEFIEVFRENNGFDVAVGNPPWLKVLFEEKGLMSEIYPELEIRKVTAPQVKKLQVDFLSEESRQDIYFAEYIENESSAVFMNAIQNYPLLKGQQTNLYKCVLENGLHWMTENGYLGLIHPEGIYDDPNGYALRAEIYPRLKYHFQFKNELTLFSDIDVHNVYSINIYSGVKSEISFYNINNLYHPSTIDGSFIHQGNGICGGLRTRGENGKFERSIESHKSRINIIDVNTLKIFAQTFENSNQWQGTKLVRIHAKEILTIIERIGKFISVVSDFENKVSVCWDETNDVNAGHIQRNTKFPNIDAYEMIYSGPHVFVSNPMFKNPREKCIVSSDYDIIDLQSIDESYVARTNYIPVNVMAGYTSTIRGFQIENDVYDNWLDYYKLAFRKMLNQTSEHTLSGAILPPKSSHIFGLVSIIFRNTELLVEFSGLTSSLVYDFFVKTLGTSNLTDSRIMGLPLGITEQYKSALFVRTLLLNCINKYYAPLWQESYQEVFESDTWSVADARLKPFATLSPQWEWSTPLRNYFERRMALVEIDVITAMALSLTLEELILMYNVQFPVLQQNEDDTWYDTRGNIVFTCSKGLVGVGLDRPDWEQIKDMPTGETYEHTITKSELYNGQTVTYYAPFAKCDRVEDYKRAWAHFEKRFENKQD